MSRWGKLINAVRDEGRVFHMLKEDNSPACGCTHFTTTGTYPGEIPDSNKCFRCKAVERAQKKKTETKK